jgi:hypothetical protein
MKYHRSSVTRFAGVWITLMTAAGCEIEFSDTEDAVDDLADTSDATDTPENSCEGGALNVGDASVPAGGERDSGRF